MSKEWFEYNLEDINSPEEFDNVLEEAHNAGFDLGFEAGEEEGYNEGLHSAVVEQQLEDATKEAYSKGVEREQNRIQQVIQMQMKWAEDQNKGRDYMFWKNVRDSLTPFNFEPWSDERWQEELEKDGF